MRRNRIPSRRRGLTLLELLLAAAITAMVAAAIAGMLGAVSAGVDTRRDQRTVMVLSSSAYSRLGAYIAPSRCVLAQRGPDLTLWFNDSRQSDTVHATEIRWLTFDSGTGTINARFVQFPDDWTDSQRNLEDLQYPNNSNWDTVLAYYETRGWIQTVPMIDHVQAVAISRDHATAMEARHVVYDLTFDTSFGGMLTSVSATIRQHAPPVR